MTDVINLLKSLSKDNKFPFWVRRGLPVKFKDKIHFISPTEGSINGLEKFNKVILYSQNPFEVVPTETIPKITCQLAKLNELEFLY